MKFILKLCKFFITWIILPAILIYVGWAQIYPLFTGEFTQHLGSIEVSYIQMARFIESSSPQFLWQPNWYLGYPMSVLYTPLLPILEYLAKIFFNISYSHAYRVITAFGYIGVLVSIYLLGKEISKSALAGFVSGLIFGICPSIFSLMYSEIGADSFLTEIIEPRRFTNLIRWGEGPHTISLFFVPLAGLFLLKFLKKGNKFTMLLAVFFSAIVAMTNIVGAWALILLDFSLIFGSLCEKDSEFINIIKKSLLVTLLTYGVIAFWFNSVFLSTFFREGGSSLNYWSMMFPWGLMGIIIIFILFYLFGQKILSKISGLSGTCMFLILTFVIVNTYFASGESKLELVPQALRLSLETDIAVALMIGLLVSVVINLIAKINKAISYGVSVSVLGFAILFFGPRQLNLSANLPKYTQSLEKTGKDLKTTNMYQVAQNLSKKVKADERVFVAGNYSFYLNYFANIGQLRGALYQSATHPWAEHIYYQETNGSDAQISLAWLKIANIGKLVISGQGDIYADDFKHPDKFDNILEFDEEIMGDKYYNVPLVNASLAKGVAAEISKVTTPVNAIDREPILQYVNILESGKSKLNIKQIQNNQYQISGNLEPGELILTQITHADGWVTYDEKGKKLEVKKDPLGFILIKPLAANILINLQYQNPISVKIGKLVTILTGIIILILIIKLKNPLMTSDEIKKFSNSTDTHKPE